MCLAKALLLHGGKEELIAEDIESFEIRPGKVILTDFLGRKQVVEGTLLSSNMTDNTIRIAEKLNIPDDSLGLKCKKFVNEKDTLMKHIGMELIQLDASGGKAILNIKEGVLNVMGVVHGGVYFIFADVLAGCIAMAASGNYVLTINSQIQMLSGKSMDSADGKLIATGVPIHVGSNIVVVEVNIEDESEKLLSKVIFSFKTRPYYIENTNQ